MGCENADGCSSRWWPSPVNNRSGETKRSERHVSVHNLAFKEPEYNKYSPSSMYLCDLGEVGRENSEVFCYYTFTLFQGCQGGFPQPHNTHSSYLFEQGLWCGIKFSKVSVQRRRNSHNPHRTNRIRLGCELWGSEGRSRKITWSCRLLLWRGGYHFHQTGWWTGWNYFHQRFLLRGICDGAPILKPEPTGSGRHHIANIDDQTGSGYFLPRLKFGHWTKTNP